MYRIFRPLFGSYTVRLNGGGMLSFVHTLASNRILFWHLAQQDGFWTLDTTLSHAEPLLACATQNGIEAEIIHRHGLPFLIARYKKRVGLLVGLLLGLALLFYAELFVWKITVNGNTLLSDEEIIEALNDYGIGVGSFIPRIPVLQAQNEFLIKYGELSSFAINIKGTHIQVEVLERTHTPEIEQKNGFCNIVSAYDGIVLSVEAVDGTEVVKVGDVVSKGQLLVSAYTVAARNIYRLHHARGKIEAQVYEQFSQVVPLSDTRKHYTGREQVKTTVTAFGKAFDLFWTEQCAYEQFDAEVTREPIVLLGIIETPFVKTTAVFREYTSETVILPREQAELRARAAFDAYLARQTDEVIDYDCKIVYDEIQNACVINASVTFKKSIGIDKPLLPGEEPPEQVKPPAPQY